MSIVLTFPAASETESGIGTDLTRSNPKVHEFSAVILKWMNVLFVLELSIFAVRVSQIGTRGKQHVVAEELRCASSWTGLLIVFQQQVVDVAWHKVVDGKMLVDALAYVRAADGVESGIDQVHVFWQVGFVNGEAAAWVDQHFVVGEDVFGISPAVERQPVVSANDEHKLAFGKIEGEILECVPHVRRLGEMELVVGGYESRTVMERLAGELKAQLVGKEVVGRGFKGIEGADNKPYLVNRPCFQNLLCQGDMPIVNGVETAAEDAGT